MDNFLSRERAIEGKFQYDQLVEYKVLARRNRLFGLWICELMGKEEETAETYAREIVSGKYCTSQGDALIAKVLEDLAHGGINLSEHVARKQLNYCYKDASKQMHEE